MNAFCAKCNRTISPSSLASTLLGHNYHTYCLTCTTCNKPLWNKQFRQTKDGLFCYSDCEAENNVINNSNSMTLPSINNKQVRQPLASNIANATRPKQPFYQYSPPDKGYSKEDTMSSVLRQGDFFENARLSPPPAPTLQQQQQPLNREAKQIKMMMPPANEQMQLPMREPSNVPVARNPVNGANPLMQMSQPVQSYGSTNRTNLMPSMTKSRQNTNLNKSGFMSVNKQGTSMSMNSLGGSMLISKPFTNYTVFNETPTFEKEFDLSQGVRECAVCAKPILKDSCNFNDRYYHSKCFHCSICDVELYNMKKVLVTEHNGNEAICCEPCYSRNFGPKCGKCNEPVTPHMLSTNYDGQLFHRECFICARCKHSLAELEFKKSGKLYICRNCY